MDFAVNVLGTRKRCKKYMVDSSICNCTINVDFGGWTGGPKTEEHPKLTQDTAYRNWSRVGESVRVFSILNWLVKTPTVSCAEYRNPCGGK